MIPDRNIAGKLRVNMSSNSGMVDVQSAMAECPHLRCRAAIKIPKFRKWDDASVLQSLNVIDSVYLARM